MQRLSVVPVGKGQRSLVRATELPPECLGGREVTGKVERIRLRDALGARLVDTCPPAPKRERACNPSRTSLERQRERVRRRLVGECTTAGERRRLGARDRNRLEMLLRNDARAHHVRTRRGLALGRLLLRRRGAVRAQMRAVIDNRPVVRGATFQVALDARCAASASEEREATRDWRVCDEIFDRDSRSLARPPVFCQHSGQRQTPP